MSDTVGDTATTSLRHSSLIDVHRHLGAKLVAFGGWEMPLAYPRGTIAEHRACRSDAVAFDVSHLGTVRLDGTAAFDRLQTVLSNDLARIGPGRAQYTHLLDDHDGSVVDDLIVWWRPDGIFDIMPNASNTERVLESVGGVDVTDTRCVIAVQGPTARARLAQVIFGAETVGRFDVAQLSWGGVPCLVAGTGYTGEEGVECAVPAGDAGALWQALSEVGVVPAGLGARDTLRLEAALPLHGHELGPGITPLQAGLAWVVGWDKPTFRGRRALLAERGAVGRHLIGLTTEGRQPPRQGAEVSSGGRSLGVVTSGNFSPMLGRGIALALVTTAIELPPSAPVTLEQRGRSLTGTVVSTPFVRPGQWAGDHPSDSPVD
ncbi:MAG: glycine cleavage system aminomethyltransferase GcvT [Acidimicrobiales bacterium]